MKAALLEKIRTMSVGDQPDPGLPADHVLVRVATSAICGTDVSIWAGKMPARIPLIPGHECTGAVEHVGESVTRLKIGDRVVLNPLSSCGSCFYCVRGLTNICLNGGLLGPGGAGHLRRVYFGARDRSVRLSREREFRRGDELRGSVHGRLQPEKSALYSRARAWPSWDRGAAACSIPSWRKSSGAESVIAVTRSKWKLEVARRMGADEIVPAGEVDPVEAVRELTDGLGRRHRDRDGGRGPDHGAGV